MSNMPLIPVSSAPIANNAGSQTSASSVLPGTTVSTPGAATAAPTSVSAPPVNFAQALLDLRNAALVGTGTPLADSNGPLPLGGSGQADAGTAELLTISTDQGGGLPLAGMGLPLELPASLSTGKGDTIEVVPVTAVDTLSLSQSVQSDLFACAGTFPGGLTVQSMTNISLEAYDRPFSAGQGAGQLFSEAMLRTQPSFQSSAAHVDALNGQADSFLSALQSKNFAVGPQFTAGVIASVSTFAATQLPDSATVNLADTSMNPVQTLPTSTLGADSVAPRPAQSTWVTTISAPVATPDWDTAMGEHVKFMAKNELSFAEIRVTPPQLGPVEVRLTVQNDQAQVTLFATHAATRDALEAALPRLRDMFADAGLNLAGANVATESFAEQRGREGSARGTSDPALPAGSDNADDEQSGVRTLAVRGGSALDVFA